jgi:hypothetical protein
MEDLSTEEQPTTTTLYVGVEKDWSIEMIVSWPAVSALEVNQEGKHDMGRQNLLKDREMDKLER